MNDSFLRRSRPRAALFAVAHAPYWAQFPGLRERLESLHGELREKLATFQVDVLDFGIVDSSETAYDVARRLGTDIEMIFCNMITYATSSVVAPILRAASVPVILVALQPRTGLDYRIADTRMQLENDNICSVPEFIGVGIRVGHPVRDVVLGCLYNDPAADAQLREWCEVASVLRALKGARFGLMGHVLESMYDMHTDPTAVFGAFGIHVPLLEIDDLLELSRQVSEDEIRRKEDEIRSQFDMPDPKQDPITCKLTAEDLRDQAQSAVALEKFIEKHRLSGLAYYYEGIEDSDVRRLASTLIVGNSLLIAHGFPMCGEFDLKTCIAMFLMDRLGMGGSFAEFHPFDFENNCILIGHDGPHHIRIAQGKPVLRSLTKFHGKPGHGASVEFKLREGPITMLGITQKADGGFKFVIGEGMSVEGEVPPTGNTNTRAVFPPDTRDFVRRWVLEGPTHHYALGIGHRAETLKKLAEVLGIEAVIVR